MEAFWVVSTALLVFCVLAFMYLVYRIGCGKGYKLGAEEVLRQWKDTLKDMEE